MTERSVAGKMKEASIGRKGGFVIKGVGVDLASISETKDAIDGDPVFERYAFTQRERSYARSRGKAEEHFAVMLALKEAVTKALAPVAGKDVFDTKDIEVLHTAAGAPFVADTPSFSAFLAAHGIESVHVSATHEGEYACGIAVAEGPADNL
ncbi:4'-phosphopantetheinyl transferase superfamily protein [Eggerthellaceae bacterium zg-893]|nr:4'-phosphopantetheinyl transferase superfamily protein [Eggerthellaceae bacterium zg-893]